VIELSLLIKVGTLIGTLNTVVLVITTAMVGSYLVKMEGINVIYRFQQNMQEGIFPAEEILDGAMILVAGCLLVTPGILTDIIGFSFVFPMSRMAIKRLLRRYIDKKIATMNVRIHRP
jgi:UPF0716 protein FxsA